MKIPPACLSNKRVLLYIAAAILLLYSSMQNLGKQKIA
ncbi:hypothetical protein T260_16640 [Geobacillus thermopakistaniensis]|uniref:Uncharacterized protein n=1 Tax=Geobacillus thermopakistaniensis (strain MAS1) TaxID=1408282 RepID=A0A7U9P500_GEOTM|nr:hypothetical protein GA8_16335 [Geobacillus sp. A8]ESU70870.1 hypothetical protein T260_16640 [Geobacillus sp. MAS1]